MTKRRSTRPRCPMCDTRLVSAAVPCITRRGEKIQCECGAVCWVRQTTDGSGWFVAMFRAGTKRRLTVRSVRAHETRVRNAGALALNSLTGAARQRVVLAWLNVHWDLMAADDLRRSSRSTRPATRTRRPPKDA